MDELKISSSSKRDCAGKENRDKLAMIASRAFCKVLLARFRSSFGVSKSIANFAKFEFALL